MSRISDYKYDIQMIAEGLAEEEFGEDMMILDDEDVTHVITFKLCTGMDIEVLETRLMAQLQDATVLGGFNITEDEAATLRIQELE